MLCLYCGKEVEYKGVGRPPKYCSECAYLVDKIKKRIRIRRERSLGTSDFLSHRKKDIIEEYDEIQKELKRHGVVRQFT